MGTDEKIEYGSKEYNSTLTDFKKGREWLNDVNIELPAGINELTPLEMLRAYEQEPTIDSSMALASSMIINREIRFKRDKEVLLDFTYNGGDLSIKFEKAPYLLDMLLKMCYGILIKKLTPPSGDSKTEEVR